MTFTLSLIILGVLCLSVAVSAVCLDVSQDVDQTNLMILVLGLSAVGFGAIAIAIQNMIQ